MTNQCVRALQMHREGHYLCRLEDNRKERSTLDGISTRLSMQIHCRSIFKLSVYKPSLLLTQRYMIMLESEYYHHGVFPPFRTTIDSSLSSVTELIQKTGEEQ
jgi:hypothetical protein